MALQASQPSGKEPFGPPCSASAGGLRACTSQSPSAGDDAEVLSAQLALADDFEVPVARFVSSFDLWRTSQKARRAYCAVFGLFRGPTSPARTECPCRPDFEGPLRWLLPRNEIGTVEVPHLSQNALLLREIECRQRGRKGSARRLLRRCDGA